ncbi:MAG: hypothetical protein EA378_11380 [Phycisphaerales bacterium]|nr:MAG: hypothetical protein EA378_11380 [Phycisphaerales bacterium]
MTKTIIIAAAAVAALAGAAHANSITNVALTGGAGSEMGVGQIYSALTGISLANNAVNQVGAGSGSVGIGAGTIAGRVSDDRDMVWRDGSIDVGFAALYWGNSNTPDGNANHTISVTQDNGAATTLFQAGPGHSAQRGEIFSSSVFPTTADIRFSAHNHTSGVTASTDPLNNNGRDRVITFDITGLETLNVSALGFGGQNIDLTSLPALGAGKGTFLMFFETGSDDDFQDIVILAHNIKNVPIVPAPSAAALGLLGLGGIVARRRR